MKRTPIVSCTITSEGVVSSSRKSRPWKGVGADN